MNDNIKEGSGTEGKMITSSMAFDPFLQGYYGKGGEDGIQKLMDPFDLTGYRSGNRLEAAQRLQQAATMQAIQAQEDMYRRGLEHMRPYRDYGARALPALTESLQPGSQLGTMRSSLAQKYMPQSLGGFSQNVIDDLLGRYNAAIGAQEETARMNRAKDVMGLGMGGAAQASGMAGQQGRGLADLYLMGAQQQGQLAAEQSLARRQGKMGMAYGGYRTAMDYLGG